jgi:hypothetical protein
MISRSLQLFFIAFVMSAVIGASGAELKPGSVASLTFEDVDGKHLSTADGHVTIITVITRALEAEAHAVAGKVPERYKGDQKYRYITLVNFKGGMGGLLPGVTRGMIRSRLDAEAKELKSSYERRKIAHEPREDLFVIPDFDGSAVSKLGLSPEAGELAVFIFNGSGKLVQRWSEVPPDDSLAKALVVAAE